MTKSLSFTSTFALVFLASFGVGALSAHAAITRSLDVGSSGADVTELQTYLAAHPDLYPSGLVTGYFGLLTQAGVQHFQAGQGIVSSGSPETTGYGRVGPTTRARLNALMGGDTSVSWDAVPVLSTPFAQYASTSATITWSSNELTTGQVYYSTSPIQADEATAPHQVPYVSGTLAVDAAGMQTGHVVSLQNLSPNTTYYYLIRGIDGGGNLSMSLVSNFHTNP